jgi:hypothetical protein
MTIFSGHETIPLLDLAFPRCKLLSMKMTVAQFYRHPLIGTRETTSNEEARPATLHPAPTRVSVYPFFRARGFPGRELSPTRGAISRRYCCRRRGPSILGSTLASWPKRPRTTGRRERHRQGGWGPLPYLLRLNVSLFFGDGGTVAAAQVSASRTSDTDFESVKLIIITNGSGLSRPSVGALGRLRQARRYGSNRLGDSEGVPGNDRHGAR